MLTGGMRDAVILANLTDGRRLFLRYAGADDPGRKYTAHRRWAWRLPRAAAGDVIQDLHRVQAGQGHHAEVAFFEVVAART